MSIPSSVIYICRYVKLTNSYEHSIYFDSAAAQQAYFADKVVRSYSNYTYLRKNHSIKVDATSEEAASWSYLFFRNGSSFEYYFITDKIYTNDNTVELVIELDVLQTYLDRYELLPSFVEREHAKSDGIGENLIDEGLELGELITIDETSFNFTDLCILVFATFNPLNTNAENTDRVLAAKYNNVYSGLGVYAVNLDDWQAWGAKLDLINAKLDGIVSMIMYPKSLVTLAEGASWSDDYVTKEVSSVSSVYKNVGCNTKTAGTDKAPKNNKLLTYPYNFIYVHNNEGQAAVYHYEKFGDPSYCNFRAIGALSAEGEVKMYPLNYKGVQHNTDEGLLLGNYPTCAWNSDTYKLWLAQNQNQQKLGLAGAGLKIAAGAGVAIASAGVGAAAGLGLAASGASDIAGLLALRADKSIEPPQARGQASSSVSLANNFKTFTIQRKSITPEYAVILDDYFSMYGYKTNRVKVPNTHVRQNWTYTKTINCHVQGDFDFDDQRKIESIFNRGVTFWVNGDKICDYSLSNNTI